MNLTKRTICIIIALALVFTTLVFVSVGATGTLAVHDTVVSYSGGSIQNGKGKAPSYLSSGKIAYFNVESAGYSDKSETVIPSQALSNATGMETLVTNAESSGSAISIDLYAEFETEKSNEKMAAAVNFGCGWIQAQTRFTNVASPTVDHTVDFVNGEVVTLSFSADEVLNGTSDYADLTSAIIKITPADQDKVTGTFYYTAPYIAGSQQISTVEVTRVPVTTTPETVVNDGTVDIYDSPCKISGYNKAAYDNSKFIMGDEGGKNEGRYAYIQNANKEDGNIQIQCRVNFSGFAELYQQAVAQGKSICMDVYTNSFDYMNHSTGSTAGDQSFCYLRYEFQGGRPISECPEKDIVFYRNLKQTLVFTANIVGESSEYMNFQFQNYNWSGYNLDNFEFIVSAPYLEGSEPSSVYTPSTTTTTTTYVPPAEDYSGEISAYDNGVKYTKTNAWNGTNRAVVGDMEGYEGQYVHIDSINAPQQIQGQLYLSGVSALKEKAIAEGKAIYIDVYANDFSNGSVTPGKCDFKVSFSGGGSTGDKDRIVTAGRKQTLAFSADKLGNGTSLNYTLQNYSYGDYKSIKGAKFIISVPYIDDDVASAKKVTPVTTTTTTTTTTTIPVSHVEDEALPITIPNTTAKYTGGWGNPSNQVFISSGENRGKLIYIESKNYNGRIQMYNNVDGFGDLLVKAAEEGKKVCFDFYGEFLQPNATAENSSAKIKISFGSNLWFGNDENATNLGTSESDASKFIQLKPYQVVTQSYDAQAVLDAFKAVTTTTKNPNAGIYEVEKLTVSEGSTAAYSTYNQTDLQPNGTLHQFDNTEVGQYVEYTIPSQKAATYNLSLSSRDYTQRGKFKVTVNGETVVDKLSFIASDKAYVTHDLGQYTLKEDGDIVIRLECVEPSSGSVSMALDSFTCINSDDATSSTTASAGISNEEVAKNIKLVWPHILGYAQNSTTRGRYYMTAPYIEGENDGSITETGPTTTTTRQMPDQPTDNVDMPSAGWNMSKINLDYVDCRFPSIQWSANGSRVTGDTSKKFVTFETASGGKSQQVGGKINVNGGTLTKSFADYIAYAKQAGATIAFDVYPEFSVNDNSNYAYIKCTFGSFTWPYNEKAFKITAGKKYTYYVSPEDLPENTSDAYFTIQNYEFGDGYMNNVKIYITAPYLVDADPDLTTTTTTTTQASTTKTSTKAYPSNNAGGQTKFYVSNTNVEQGGTVKVPIMITNNAGLFSAKFSIKYNTNALSLARCENGDVFDTISVNDTFDNGIVEILVQQRANNATANGVVAYLVFDADFIDGNSEIVFAGTGYVPANFFDFDGKNVACSFKSGHVIIGKGGSPDEIIPDPGKYIPYPTTNTGTTVFTIDSISEELKSGVKSKEFAINVSVKGNEGLSRIKFAIRYDSNLLEFVSSSPAESIPPVFNLLDYNFEPDSSNEGFLIYDIKLNDSNKVYRDTTTNGNIVTIKFKLKDYQVGNYAVEFGGEDYLASNYKNADNENVACSFISGGIEVKSASNQNSSTQAPTTANQNPGNNGTSVIGATTVTGVKLTGKKAALVTWNAVANATNYQVFRAEGSSNQFKLVYSGANTSYTDNALSAGKTYTYKVKASETGSFSNSLSITTMNYNTKATVKSLKSTKKKTLKVSIKKKITGATGYQIQYSTNKKFKKAKSTTTNSLSKTVKKLTSNKKYYVRVRSLNIVNGKKVYGKWSTAKNKIVK